MPGEAIPELIQAAEELLGPDTPFIYQRYAHHRPVEVVGSLGTPTRTDTDTPIGVLDAHVSPLNARDSFDFGASQSETFGTITIKGLANVRQYDYFINQDTGERWDARTPGIDVESAGVITTASVDKKA